MKVRDAIEKLGQLNPEAELVIVDDRSTYDVVPVESIEPFVHNLGGSYQEVLVD